MNKNLKFYYHCCKNILIESCLQIIRGKTMRKIHNAKLSMFVEIYFFIIHGSKL